MMEESDAAARLFAADFWYDYEGRSPGGPGPGPLLRVEDPFEAFGGEMVGLCGPNGSGKTTLFFILAQALAPTGYGPRFRLEYDARAGGREFHHRTTLPGDRRPDPGPFRNAAIGPVFQRNLLLRSLGVLPNVELPLALRADFDAAAARERSTELLDALGFPEDRRALRSSSLSGGESKVVALARAMATEPPFLFADEPTAGVGGEWRRRVLSGLRAHADAGNCVIMVSHEPEALDHCDRIVQVRGGRVVGPRGTPGWRPPAPVPVPVPPSAPAPVAAATQAPERLGLRGRAARMALGEVFSGRQFVLRSVMALLLAAGVGGFALVTDLLVGLVEHAGNHTLGPNRYLSVVRAWPPRDQQSGFTPAQRDYLRGLGGKVQSAPTFRQQLGSLRVYDRDGRPQLITRTYSVPIGDMTVQRVEPAALRDARYGLEFLTGDTFTAAQRDAGGMLIEFDQLRSIPGHGDLDPAHPEAFPRSLDLCLGRDSDVDRPRWELPGFDGRVAVPISVFRYTPSLLRQKGDGEALPKVYLPEGFLARLASGSDPDRPGGWKPHHAASYPSASGAGPLVSCPDLVTTLRVRPRGPGGDAWLGSALIQAKAVEPFLASPVAGVEGGELVVRLEVRTEPTQRITEAVYRERFWPELRKAIADEGGDAELRCVAEPVGHFFGPPPGLGEVAFHYQDASLTFDDIEAALRAYDRIQKEHPELSPWINNREAIEQFLAVRSLVGEVTGLARWGLTAVLLFLVGFASWAHVAVGGKAGDVGILRFYGMRTRQIAGLYQLEILLYLLPACAVGVAMSQAAARRLDPPVAARVAAIEGAARQADGGTSKARVASPPIFRSRQVGDRDAAAEAAGVLAWAAAALALGSASAVVLVARQTLGITLRSGED